MDDENRQLAIEVGEWLDKLKSSVGTEKQQAARELSRLGIKARSSIRTRGSLTTAAENRLPEPDRLRDLLRALQDTNKAVRCQVALALGEWGGQEAAQALQEVLQNERDEDVQLYCITGLETIGGAAAVEGLRYAVRRGTDAVRHAALTAIEELATQGRIEDTEGPPPRPLPPRQDKSEPGWRGGVRVRGGGASAPDKLDRLVADLEQVRAARPSVDYLRARVDEVLGYLEH